MPWSSSPFSKNHYNPSPYLEILRILVSLYLTAGMSKLFHKGPCGCRRLFQPISCLKTQFIWWNEFSLVCCCLVRTKTCSHTTLHGIVWTSLPPNHLLSSQAILSILCFPSLHSLCSFVHNVTQIFGFVQSGGIPSAIVGWRVCVNLSAWVLGHDTPKVVVMFVWGLSQHCAWGVTPGPTLFYFSCDCFHVPLLSPSPACTRQNRMWFFYARCWRTSQHMLSKTAIFSGISHCLGPIPVFAFAHFIPAVMQHVCKNED